MEDSIFRKARRKAATTNPDFRDAGDAGDVLLIDRSRLLGIETGRILPRPEEIVAMAKAYKTPELCSYYCSQECQVGRFMGYPKIDGLKFPEIAISLMSAMHFFGQATDTIFGIFDDNEISENEIEEFKKVFEMLDKLSASSDALKLWAKQRGIIE